MFERLRQRFRDWYSDRNDREQLLMKVAAVVLPLVAIAFVGVLYNQSLNSIRQDIKSYERTLELLGNIAPEYGTRQNSGDTQSDKFSEKALENNDIKLTSFVATHATAVGIQVDSYDETDRRIGGEEEGGPPLSKLQVDVEIRKAPTDKLMKLLERIEKADEPVVIERVTLSRKKRDAGKVRGKIVVTTFKRKGEG